MVLAVVYALEFISIQGLPQQRDLHRWCYLQPTAKASEGPMMQRVRGTQGLVPGYPTLIPMTLDRNKESEPMRDQAFRKHAWLLCLPMLVSTPTAQAQDQLVDLQSSGGYTSYRLADDVTQVDLVEQTQGACRFNRTWGYDLTNRELWTNGGCGGRFKITRTYASGNNSGSNAGAAVAAVAAIAGIALLANHNRHDDDRRPEYPGYPGQGGDWGREIRVDSRLCLDVRGGKFQPGTTLQVYECNGTASQRFAVGRGGEIRVRDLCVDVDRGDPRDGARVVLWSCSGSRSQSWFTRGGQIVSQLTGKCLDVDAGQVRPGAHTMVWPCNRSPSQRWWW